ncbi:hypothetical protein COD17_10085 [Bacillus thuringiensis]|nr:hypothetical protein COD17_10085 [Bacillus thuringiensis]
MRLVFDLILFLYMFVFAYAIGRRRSDGTKVIPVEVTSRAMLVALIIFALINLPSIWSLMTFYGK